MNIKSKSTLEKFENILNVDHIQNLHEFIFE